MILVTAYRHAESEANAGLATASHHSIGLTTRGQRQAQELADTLARPDLIVSSPFTRAVQTAAPTILRFPNVPTEVWPIEEFTYLSPISCSGTTPRQREPRVRSYWDQADSRYCDGPGAETFDGFLERVLACLARLREFDAQAAGPRSIAMFGHGQFLQALRWISDVPGCLAEEDYMRRFRSLDLNAKIANCEATVLKVGW